jgi:hypothetical protein
MIHKASLVINFRAEDCDNMTVHKPNKPSLDSKGIQPFARAPAEWFPDLTKIIEEPDTLYEIGRLVRNFDKSQLRILISVLHQSHELMKQTLLFQGVGPIRR